MYTSAGFAAVDVTANFPRTSVKTNSSQSLGRRGFSSSQLASGQHVSTPDSFIIAEDETFLHE